MRDRGIRIVAASLVAAVLVTGHHPAALAAPVFARKYGFNCTMCHSNFPRLNDFGQRYRANGYRLPGRENVEKTVLETPAPVAMRTSAGWNYDRTQHVPGAEKTNQFEVNGLDVLSGGLMNARIGYFAVLPPEIKGDKGVAGQDGTIEMASLVLSDLGRSPWLNLRVGRFEPACVAFSVKRSLTASPYEIYEFAFPGGPSFASTQDGIELAGHGRRGLSYAVGWLNGSATNPPGDKPADFYARVAKVFGPGEGQTAGQRVGLVAYAGQARPDTSVATGGSREGFQVYGADASLNLGHFNLALAWLYANYDQSLLGTASDQHVTGGFGELTFLPATSLVAFARYDAVSSPNDLRQDVWRLTGGGRLYFADNVALHIEYSRRSSEAATPGGEDGIEDSMTARMDFAF